MCSADARSGGSASRLSSRRVQIEGLPRCGWGRRKEGETVSILVNKNTRVVVQGITGKEGSFHATQCKAYGTKVVAGVTPGKAGQEVEGIPVFNTVAEVVKQADCATSLILCAQPLLA